MNAEEQGILERIEARTHAGRLERAAQWTPEMIVSFQDAFLADRQARMIEVGVASEAAKIMARQTFDIWEHNSLNAFGRRK